jgi:hypothetical protein
MSANNVVVMADLSAHFAGDRRPILPISLCECCGVRPSPITRVQGVYEVSKGWYCVPCEVAIKRAPHTEITPESKAFVARLASRPPAAPATGGRGA